ncbi:dystrophin-like isoform X1 [Varroa jacobsoni]|uniref:dystrophin-like isoform X1 n=1 Tax=Varroa jacobsoni TaxID=62625 RepID=UPI000BF4BC35|nr:dystrophin-like isoform X1 [Varroa jacobsoni]
MDPSVQDEREDVQKKAFAKWINQRLVQGGYEPLKDLFLDLRDGTRLLQLLEALCGRPFPREKGRLRVHHMNNVSRALQVLDSQNVKLVNISTNDIVDGNSKLTLGLIWSIILHWQAQDVLRANKLTGLHTSLERTLLAWCQEICANYANYVTVTNFTTSWQDGWAFNALLHYHSPDMFNFENLFCLKGEEKLEHAFEVAHTSFGIDKLLDPEDMAIPDRKSVMMYVMCLYQRLHHLAPAGASATKTATLEGYKALLEETLARLLEAEERIKTAPEASTNEDVDVVKQMYYEHEAFMQEVRRLQESAVDVLRQGRSILKNGSIPLQDDEAQNLNSEISYVNKKLQELRDHITQRQTKLYEVLMTLQQRQLTKLRNWLTEREDVLSTIAQPGPDFESTTKQVDILQELQEAIEQQQELVTSLGNMIINVDDPDFTDLEDQLTAIGERYTMFCQLVEENGVKLHQMHAVLQLMIFEEEFFSQWFQEKEDLLATLEDQANAETTADDTMLIQSLQKMTEALNSENTRLTQLCRQLQLTAEKQDKGCQALMELTKRCDVIVCRWDVLIDRMDVLARQVAGRNKDKSNLWLKKMQLTQLRKDQAGGKDQIDSIQASSNKKRKLERGGVSRKSSFSELTKEVSLAFNTLNRLETLVGITGEGGRVGTFWEGMSAEEQIRKLDEADKIIKKTRLEITVQDAICALDEHLKGKVADVSGDTLRQKSAELERRWLAVQTLVRSQRERALGFLDIENLKNGMDMLVKDIESKRRFIHSCEELVIEDDAPDLSSSRDQVNITKKLWECQQRLATAHKQKEQVQQLSQDATDTQAARPLLAGNSVFAEFQEVVQEWHDTHLEMEELERQLQASLRDGPPPKLLKSVSLLDKWIGSINATLLGDSLAVKSLEQMEEQLKNYMDFQEQVNKEEGNLHELNNTAEDLLRLEHKRPWADSFERQLAKMNQCWHSVTNTLSERIRVFNRHVDTLRSLRDEMCSINSWMDGIAEFVEDHDKRWSMIDLDKLEELLDQTQNLRSDVAILQPNVDMVNHMAGEIRKVAEPAFAIELQKSVKAMNQRWAKITEEASSKASALKDAIHTNNSITEELRNLYRWIELFEKETFPTTPMELGVDVQSRIKHLQAQREKKKAKDCALEKLERQMTQMLKAGKLEDVEDLKEDLDTIKVTWTELDSRVDKMEEALRGALPKLATFKNLIVMKIEWLNKLEKKLKKLPQAAVDAEEASGLLDELETLIESAKPERIREISQIRDDLLGLNVMTEYVHTESGRIFERNRDLLKQATEGIELLERMIKEAQDTEDRITILTNSIAKSEETLKKDISKEDIEQKWDDMTRVKEVIDILFARAKEYANDGRSEAAKRISERVEVFAKRHAAVVTKLRANLIPADFEEKLANVEASLTAVETTSKEIELTTHESELIEQQLKKCMDLYGVLSAMKPDMEILIRNGRNYSVYCKDPADLNRRLDVIKERYNVLGDNVPATKVMMEEALDYSREVEGLYNALAPWLEQVRMDYFEPEYVQKIQGELDQRRQLFHQLFERFDKLNALSTKDLALLKKSIEPLKECFFEAEHLFAVERRSEVRLKLDSFNGNCIRIKTWLEGAELYFEAKEEYTSSPAGQRRLHGLYNEMHELNEVVKKLREVAIELMKADDKYTLLIQPQLTKLSERWNSMVDRLREKAGAGREDILVELKAFLERMEAVEQRVNDMCLIQSDDNVLEECDSLARNLSAETVVMDAAAGELDKKIALSGLFTVEWSQARERWLRCRKMMESTQRRAEDAREKWQSFETDITDKREAVKKLLEQLVQALDNAKNGVKDNSLESAARVGDEVNLVKKKAQDLQDLGIPSNAIRNKLGNLTLIWNKAQLQIAELKNIRRISSSHGDVYPSREDEAGRIKYSTPQRLDSAYSSPTSSLAEYHEKVNNLRDVLSHLQRMLADENFTEFGLAQQELLQTIKESIASLKVPIDNTKMEHKTVYAANDDEAHKLTSLVEGLLEQWTSLKSSFATVNERWLKNKETWLRFNSKYKKFTHWLDTMEANMKESTEKGRLQLSLLKKKMPDYESQAAEHLPVYDRTKHLGRTLLTQCGPVDVSDLASKLDLIEKRWKSLLLELQKSKTYEKRPKSGEQLREDMLQLRAWFMEAETLLTISPPPQDLAEGFEKLENVKRCEAEMASKRTCFFSVLLSSAPQRIDIDSLGDKFSNLCQQLTDFREKLEDYLRRLEQLMNDVHAEERRLDESLLDAERFVAGRLLLRSSSFICRDSPRRGRQDSTRRSLRSTALSAVGMPLRLQRTSQTPLTSTPAGSRASAEYERDSSSSLTKASETSTQTGTETLIGSEIEMKLNEHVMLEHSRMMRNLQRRVQQLEKVFPLLPGCKTDFERCVASWQRLCAVAARCGPPLALLVAQQTYPRRDHPGAGDVLPQIEGSMGLAELSDELGELETWVGAQHKKILEIVVDFGVDDSVKEALQAYKVSAYILRRLR